MCSCVRVRDTYVTEGIFQLQSPQTDSNHPSPQSSIIITRILPVFEVRAVFRRHPDLSSTWASHHITERLLRRSFSPGRRYIRGKASRIVSVPRLLHPIDGQGIPHWPPTFS